MHRFRTLPLACSLLNRPLNTWKVSWSSTSALSQGSTTCLEIIFCRQPVSSLFSDFKKCFFFRCTTPDGSTLGTEKDSLMSSLEVIYLKRLHSLKYIPQFLSFLCTMLSKPIPFSLSTTGGSRRSHADRGFQLEPCFQLAWSLTLQTGGFKNNPKFVSKTVAYNLG